MILKPSLFNLRNNGCFVRSKFSGGDKHPRAAQLFDRRKRDAVRPGVQRGFAANNQRLIFNRPLKKETFAPVSAVRRHGLRAARRCQRDRRRTRSQGNLRKNGGSVNRGPRFLCLLRRSLSQWRWLSSNSGGRIRHRQRWRGALPAGLLPLLSGTPDSQPYLFSPFRRIFRHAALKKVICQPLSIPLTGFQTRRYFPVQFHHYRIGVQELPVAASASLGAPGNARSAVRARPRRGYPQDIRHVINRVILPEKVPLQQRPKLECMRGPQARKLENHEE